MYSIPFRTLGTRTQDFQPLVSSNNFSGASDTQVKAFLKMASNLQRYSTKLHSNVNGTYCDMHNGVIDTIVHKTLSKSSWMIKTLFFMQKSDSAAQWHRCDIHCGVNDNAVQIWHCCDFGPHIQDALLP
jgi:hypothetical protein